MNDWPEGWARGSRPADDNATRVIPPTATAPRRSREAAPPPPAPRSGRSGRGRSRGRWLRRVLLVLLLVFALLVGLLLYFFSRVQKVDALQDYPGRPAATSGQDWLLVGSDSRAGLSDAEKKRLHSGSAAGQRTDTIILLHVPSGGKPTMVSLPRDSYVPIPGHGHNKLNAAFAFGGPPLLVRTVEQATGIRIDHFAEIGFGGFVGMVEAVGGVELCPTRDIKDHKAGLNVKKGCQTMDGPTALGYVRARYFDPKGDLGRVQRQQEFLGAIFKEATSPSVLLNPFRLVRLGDAGTQALRVDQRDGPIDLVRFALAMHAISGGNGVKETVPVSDPNYSSPAGSAVRWDRPRARELFNSLR